MKAAVQEVAVQEVAVQEVAVQEVAVAQAAQRLTEGLLPGLGPVRGLHRRGIQKPFWP